MRTSTAHIDDLWRAGGPFIGTEGRPTGRVTVELGWRLRKTTSNQHDGPFRWFARADASTYEAEIPNVEAIETDASIESDSATCNFTLTNQWMDVNAVLKNGDDAELGNPGYFTFNRGTTPDAIARWGNRSEESVTFTFYPGTDTGAVFSNYGGTTAWKTGTNNAPSYSVVNSKDASKTDWLTNLYTTERSAIDNTPGSEGPARIIFPGTATPIQTTRPVKSVEIKVFAENTDQHPCIIQPVLVIDGQTYTGFGSALSSNATNEAILSSLQWTENPATGMPWTLNEVNEIIAAPGTNFWGLQGWWYDLPVGDLKIYGIWIEVTFGPTAGSWSDVIVPNALIRTYEGFGGREKTVAQALADGNIIQTGTWLVDTVQITANGKIQVSCRDMAKLLIEQKLYPPLVPAYRYPLQWCRWQYKQLSGNAVRYNEPVSTSSTSTVRVGLSYARSASDVYYGYNGAVYGHYPTQSIDENMTTYWLSVGNGSPSLPYALEWIEYDVAGPIDEVTVYPWAGNYTVFISVMENGVWQGSEVVPYNAAGVGRYVGANTANIPFLVKAGVPWETPTTYRLPRLYNAQKLRLSFSNLYNSGIGRYGYRAGVREVTAGNTTTTTGYAPALKRIVDADCFNNGNGYYLLGSDGVVYAYGLATAMPLNNNADVYGKPTAIAIAQPNTDYFDRYTWYGYYVLTEYGKVHWCGFTGVDNNFGSPIDTVPNKTWVDIAITPSGHAYYCLASDGTVMAFTPTVGEMPPAGEGDHYGDYTGTGTAVAITVTDDGQGYWVVGSTGEVQAFGSAVDTTAMDTDAVDLATSGDGYLGLSNLFVARSTSATGYGALTYSPPPDLQNPNVAIMKPRDVTGYYVVHADGKVVAVNDASFLGDTTGSFNFEYRYDGNYKDYVDIVKQLLLWSGWFIYTSGQAEPQVYGNLESTGIYADDCLDEQIFDKQPVINAINKLKEIVGYIFFCDAQGAAHWESPNFWVKGNFLDDGAHTTSMFDVDEALQLTQYGISTSDKSVVSEIIISSSLPTERLDDTVTYRYVPQNVDLLRGIEKTFVWVNESFTNYREQRQMAELVGLHTWLAQRQGQLTAAAHPAIAPNDQIRIFERQTGDTHVHYVRQVTRSLDLKSGSYMMTLRTHWMEDESGNWAIDLFTGSGSTSTTGDTGNFSNTEINDGGAGNVNNPPPPVIGSRQTLSGIATGYALPWEDSVTQDRDLNTIQNTGADVVRFDFAWDAIEATQGVYNWAKHDALVTKLEQRGMKIIGCIHQTPAWARAAGTDYKTPPTHASDYAAFAAACANRYKSRNVIAWEIWNEPNINDFWRTPNADRYFALLQAAYTAIKAVDSSVKVITGGTSPAGGNLSSLYIQPRQWYARLYQLGVASYCDAITMHPYCFPEDPLGGQSWNGFSGEIPAVRAVMVSAGDSSKKIWATEVGAPTGSTTKSLSEADQAVWVSKYFYGWFELYGAFTEYFCWYSHRDSGTDPTNWDANLGLTKNNWVEKQAYVAFINEVNRT